MTIPTAVELINISKKYVVRHEKPTLVDQIFKKGRKKKFWALRNVNLIINKGERVGIVGRNGSGKTTLLKIVNGIARPTSGKVKTNGKVVSLIDLTAGFHPELTGEENIYLNAMLLKMDKKTTKKRFKAIIRFADIGSFIDAPLYTYSEGMKLRLGFSVAVHSNPDILILDEVMSVGDRDFQKKSFARIQEFYNRGKTIILTSHWESYIMENCDRVIWIDKGKIVMDGKTRSVLSKYKKSGSEWYIM